MNLPEYAIKFQQFLDTFPALPGWDHHRTARTVDVLEHILPYVEGDLLEIGAHVGLTTTQLCKIAKKYGREVVVIDPWDGRQQGGGPEYTAFQAHTAEFDNLTVHKFGSENPIVPKALADCGRKFAFILIDGEHDYNAVTNDVSRYRDFVVPGGIISVDDWRGPYTFSANIQRAAYEQLCDGYQELVTPDSFIESYFIKLQEQA